jgi:nucleotide-binding universal stress UspA family protein
MSLKTILVHLADDEHHHERLEAAGRLARQHGAHIVALYVPTPIGMPAEITGRGASAAFLSEATAAARDKSEALSKVYAQFCRSHGITLDWIVQEGDHLDLLAQHAHAADLVVVSQPIVKTLEDRFRLRLAEEITMVAGLPVLLLPEGEVPQTVGRRVLIAWKGTREAVRAVRDALPFLKAAEAVAVLSVGPAVQDALSEREVVAYLKRHDVAAEPHKVMDDNDVGQAILNNAAFHRCDLIVMGAYGHSRLREIVMGGVTRHILYNTAIPVLMSH